MVELGALVLFSARIGDAVSFYNALGTSLVTEEHGDGARHYACQLGNCHFALYEASAGASPSFRSGGCTFPGFVVESVEESLARVRALGAPVHQEPESYPWGRRCVVEDPDGRPVEIYERLA